jgi:ABC-type sugar transport system substrate-binding protein
MLKHAKRMFFSLLVLLFSTLGTLRAQDELTILVSLPDLAFPFFVHMQAQIRAEAEAIGGINLIESDGENSTIKQTADVEAAIVQGVDAIVISPLEVAALSPVLQEAVDAGIPVVTIDRRVEGVEGILAHVGADNVRGGEIQAETIAAMFPDGATVFHLQGQPGAGPAIDRNQGVHNVLDGMAEMYPIVFEQTANFRRDEGLSVTEAGLAGLDEAPDVIVAANDDMALGALEAVTAAGLDIAIFGFDALPEALASVRDGGLTGTIEQFPGGQSRQALNIAVNFVRDGVAPESNLVLLEPIMITADNLDQAERIGELGMEAVGAPDLFAEEIAACSTDQAITIASSLPDLAFPFFVHMQNQIAAEADAIGNITLIQTDGENSTTKQTADIEAAIVQGVDAIVVSPIEVAALAPVLQDAIDAGIIVVTIDRRVEGVDGILAHVGADNVRGGEIQAETVVAMFPDGAAVFHLQGQPGAGPAIDRNQGVHNVLDALNATYPIVFEQTANFRRDEGLSVTEAGLAGLDAVPNVIIAANDDMALGALEAVTAAGLDITIFGFDALPEALASVRDGGLTGTIEQFPGGQSRTAMRIAAMQARGCAYEAEPIVLLEPIMITADNLDQAERIGELGG